jgi:hypothetical protein
VKYVDPDGKEIEKGKDIFNKFSTSVSNRIKSRENEINSLKSDLEKAEEKEDGRKIAKLKEQIADNEEKLLKYQEVANELKILSESEQAYNINLFSMDVGKDAGGNIKYDPLTHAVNVNLKGDYVISDLAHELKHAYQFETKVLSFGPDGNQGGFLYDLQDEMEAYERSSLFGDNRNMTINKLKSLSGYKNISNNTRQMTMDTPASGFEGAPTYGTQMKAQMKMDAKAGRPPRQFYKDWKLDYKN